MIINKLVKRIFKLLGLSLLAQTCFFSSSAWAAFDCVHFDTSANVQFAGALIHGTASFNTFQAQVFVDDRTYGATLIVKSYFAKFQLN